LNHFFSFFLFFSNFLNSSLFFSLKVNPDFGQPVQQGMPPTAKTPLLAQPQQGMPPPMTAVSVPVVVMANVFRESPTACTCPHCHSQIVTTVRFVNGTATFLIAGGIFILWWRLWMLLDSLLSRRCQGLRARLPRLQSRRRRLSSSVIKSPFQKYLFFFFFLFRFMPAAVASIIIIALSSS
jgi:hypothetical protein